MDCDLGTLNYEQVSVPKLGQVKVDDQLLWALPSRRTDLSWAVIWVSVRLEN